MRHARALTVLSLVIAGSAFAADLGRAIGSVTIGGTLSSKKITTNTMTFYFDAEFAAQIP